MREANVIDWRFPALKFLPHCRRQVCFARPSAQSPSPDSPVGRFPQTGLLRVQRTAQACEPPIQHHQQRLRDGTQRAKHRGARSFAPPDPVPGCACPSNVCLSTTPVRSSYPQEEASDAADMQITVKFDFMVRSQALWLQQTIHSLCGSSGFCMGPCREGLALLVPGSLRPTLSTCVFSPPLRSPALPLRRSDPLPRTADHASFAFFPASLSVLCSFFPLFSRESTASLPALGLRRQWTSSASSQRREETPVTLTHALWTLFLSHLQARKVS